MIKNITLSNVSNIPIYQQLYDQILTQIFNGDITSNMPLPSIRTAAKELGISIITVQKAWDDLERNGYIYTVPGKGSYIADLDSKILNNKKKEMLHEKLLSQLTYYKDLGVDKKEIIELVNKIYLDN